MIEHTVKSFEQEISQLRGLIAEMGGLAEVAIRDAVDCAGAPRRRQGRVRWSRTMRRMDALEVEVDRLAVRIIALRAPMADDLRDVIAALKISGVVERIGDYAKNIAKRVDEVEGRAKIEPLIGDPGDGRHRARHGPRRAQRLRRTRRRAGDRGDRPRRQARRFLQQPVPRARHPHDGEPGDDLQRGAAAVRRAQPGADRRSRDQRRRDGLSSRRPGSTSRASRWPRNRGSSDETVHPGGRGRRRALPTARLEPRVRGLSRCAPPATARKRWSWCARRCPTRSSSTG